MTSILLTRTMLQSADVQCPISLLPNSVVGLGVDPNCACSYNQDMEGQLRATTGQHYQVQPLAGAALRDAIAKLHDELLALGFSPQHAKQALQVGSVSVRKRLCC